MLPVLRELPWQCLALTALIAAFATLHYRCAAWAADAARCCFDCLPGLCGRLCVGSTGLC